LEHRAHGRDLVLLNLLDLRALLSVETDLCRHVLSRKSRGTDGLKHDLVVPGKLLVVKDPLNLLLLLEATLLSLLQGQTLALTLSGATSAASGANGARPAGSSGSAAGPRAGAALPTEGRLGFVDLSLVHLELFLNGLIQKEPRTAAPKHAALPAPALTSGASRAASLCKND
jgi:hypothetical protein